MPKCLVCDDHFYYGDRDTPPESCACGEEMSEWTQASGMSLLPLRELWEQAREVDLTVEEWRQWQTMRQQLMTDFQEDL